MDDIEKKIISTLRSNTSPLSTQDIATKVNHHWSTVQNRCLRLQNKGKIGGFRVGRVNIWVYNPEGDTEAEIETINV